MNQDPNTGLAPETLAEVPADLRNQAAATTNAADTAVKASQAATEKVGAGPIPRGAEADMARAIEENTNAIALTREELRAFKRVVGYLLSCQGYDIDTIDPGED